MAKRKIEYQETYKKGVEFDKEKVIEFLKEDDSKVFILTAGRYDNNKEFITITIDGL